MDSKPDSEPLLVAEAISGGYGSSPVVQDISMRVRPGEMLAVLGRNGCGKSTLLRLLAGALPLLSGQIHLKGQPLSSYSRRQAAQLMAVAPQDLSVPFSFSVRDVVEMGRTPYARFLQGPSAADQQAVEDALVATDTTALAHRPYQQLSGGEQQRATVALALAQQARLVLLDEPTVHLDIVHQMEILQLLRRRAHAQGLAVIAAMHDINLTCLYFDTLLVLGEGTALACGTPGEMLSSELIERAFGTRVAITMHPTLPVPQISLLP